MSSSGFLDSAKSVANKAKNFFQEKITGGPKKPDIVIKPDDDLICVNGKNRKQHQKTIQGNGQQNFKNCKKRMEEKGSFRQNVDLHLCDSSIPSYSYWFVHRVICRINQGFSQCLQ